MKKKVEQKFPPGWDEKRVREVIEYYENQTDEEAIAEMEAALEAEDTTLMAIPQELVSKVQELIARYAARHEH